MSDFYFCRHLARIRQEFTPLVGLSLSFLVAFATCAGYGSHLAFQIKCKDAASKPYEVSKRKALILLNYKYFFRNALELAGYPAILKTGYPVWPDSGLPTFLFTYR